MATSNGIKALVAVLALATACAAQAQEKNFYVAGYGGSFEQTMRKEIIPAFEKKHGVKVEYVAGNSTDTLAKLQAQKANQQIDVAIVDDGPMYQAINLGFCAPIRGLPEADIYESARYKDNKAVGIGLVGTGIMYNTKYFKEKGWAPPTSWNDLKDPKNAAKSADVPAAATLKDSAKGPDGAKNLTPAAQAATTPVAKPVPLPEARPRIEARREGRRHRRMGRHYCCR